ncbi:MAG: TonB-dependent receptor [Gammaproteobacteria bacterium]|nr:TonB-dependent receptor [Gammaproteobacteria bacterium]MBU2056645.1 TonB-dependent receptor [Gammaproteobacteria bacterium]MBU2173982.1 TonB-dependent receptor [Gammaproteobacteria bacterium]MBU2247288.1 TonB-dependent receptor [Gammaproteobacteria bacterium]MBU2344946.1 TonB-dependent receptor [Gammaproteobacteria bacterium]
MHKRNALSLAIAMACAFSAVAQQADATNTNTEAQAAANETALEVISVTATKRKTKLMETPVAISALSESQLQQHGVNNVVDIANLVPGLDISVSSEQAAPVITMRGIRSTNITELGDPAVGVHLDGIYSPRMQGALALMYDVERVEALRGPQGTLFGRNSTVGSINVLTAKPELDSTYGSVNTELGRFNAVSTGGVFNLPISDDFAVRFSGKTLKRDSYVEGYWDPNQYDTRYLPEGVLNAGVISENSYQGIGQTLTQRENWWIDAAGTDPEAQKVRALTPADKGDFYNNANEHSFRVSTLWEPSAGRFSNHTVFQYYKNDSAGSVEMVNCEKLRGRPAEFGGDCSTFLPSDTTYQAVVNVPGKLELDITYLRNTLNYELTDELNLVWLAGFEDMKRQSAQDTEIGLDVWDGAMFFLDGTGARSYSTELQLQSDELGDLVWIAGVNLFHEKTTTVGYYDNPMDDKAFWDQPDRSTDAFAAFGQATYNLSEDLHLTLGYRFSDETKEDKGGRTLRCSNADGCAPGWFNRTVLSELSTNAFENPAIYQSSFANDNKGSWQNSDFRLGLDYDFSENTMLYGYVASGFKAGGIGDVFEVVNDRTGEVQRFETQFDPEQVLTYELGTKTSLLDNSLNLQAVFFYTDYQDMQYASVGSIGNVERLAAIENPDGSPVLDGNGQPVLDYRNMPVIVYYTQNVPGSTIKGIELEFDWKPYPSGRVTGYVTWTDARITDDWITKWDYDPEYLFDLSYEESIDPENTLLTTNLKGNQLAMVPEYSANLSYTHSFDLADYGYIHSWFNVNWKDKSYNTIWNLDKHLDDMDFAVPDEALAYVDDSRDAFTSVNASLKYEPKDQVWFAELFISNATNEVVQQWSNTGKGFPKGSFGMPRYYGVRAGFNF